MKLHIPGVAEYAVCKEQFELAEKLLEKPDGEREELSTVLQTLNKNPDAVRFLEAEFGRRYGQIYNDLTKICSPALFNGTFTLSESPLDGGYKRTQEDWFDYQDETGIIIASMGDLYQNFKVLKQQYEQGSAEERAQALVLLESLREDFDWPGQKNWLISDTGLTYRGNDLETTIVQHNGGNREDLVKETTLIVPEYRGKLVEEVLAAQAGFGYLRCLFNTYDGSETIMQVLEFISGKGRKDIRVFTATVEKDKFYTRKERSDRAAGFYCGNNQFHVSGDSDIDNLPGRVRGVDLSAVGTR